MAIQTATRRYPGKFWPGVLTRPNEFPVIDLGKVYIPTNGKVIKPGQGVYYDATQNAWRLPTTDALELRVHGIVLAPQTGIPETGKTVGAGFNSDAVLEYASGDTVAVLVEGTIAVTAGGAVEYWDKVTWQNDDEKWDKYEHPQKSATYNRNENSIGTCYVTCCNRQPAVDGNIIEVRVRGAQRII